MSCSHPRSYATVPALAVLGLAALPANAWQLTTNLTLKADLAVKETFDSNVYLQDVEPNLAAVPKAASPFQESFVTSVAPRLTLDYKPCAEFAATVGYAPEVAWYHSASSENYVAHRALVNFSGRVGKVPWDLANALTYVDGSSEGLYFGGPGGAPAIGGIPIRDRRDQFVYRGAFRAPWQFAGKFFLRPVLTAYVHDFRTEQKNANVGQPDFGYENYVDRNELAAGADVGWKINPQTSVFVGYRFGNEVEGKVVGSPYHYDSEYNRPLAGLEGQPFKWMRAAVAVGPDIHHTLPGYDPRFKPNYTTIWADAVVTLLPTAQDSVMLTWKQNTQPAFASCSVYDDITYDVTGRHKFNDHWSAGAGFRLYIGDWFYPVNREDWINTVSAGLTYMHDEHLSADLAYSYDWVDSKVPNTDGREFTRHLVGLSARYSF